MGQSVVLELAEDVIERHREWARARGVPLEQELCELVTKAARTDPDEYLAEMRRIRTMTPEPPPGVEPVEGWVLIREDRDSR